MNVDIHAKISRGRTQSEVEATAAPIIAAKPLHQSEQAKFTIPELAWNALFAVLDLFAAIVLLACQVVLHTAEKRHPKIAVWIRRISSLPKRIGQRIPAKFFS